MFKILEVILRKKFKKNCKYPIHKLVREDMNRRGCYKLRDIILKNKFIDLRNVLSHSIETGTIEDLLHFKKTLFDDSLLANLLKI